MSQLARDLGYALRTLGKSQLAFIVTIVSLGLGIGAVTVVFTVGNALLFRAPVGLSEPERLVSIYTSGDRGRAYGAVSYPDYASVVEGLDALEDTAAIGFDGMKLGDGSRSVLAELVTGNYFSVIGARPALGRTFLPEEAVVGRAERVVVLSHELWRREFDGDPQVVGRTMRLNGHEHAIIGVAPDGLVSRMFSLKPDLWVPLGIPGESTHRTVEELERRDDREFRVIARLRDGAMLEDVQAQLAVLEARLRAAYPNEWAKPDAEPRRFSALSERDSRVDPEARAVLAGVALFFLGAALTILLIACSNVMSLFLAQAGRRRHEIAVRLALGASRRQIVAMLVTEGLVPGLAGGFIGVVLASFAANAISSVPLPFGIPLRFDFTVDVPVLAFAFLTSLGASLFFSLVPALQAARPDPWPALKCDTAGLVGSRRRFSLRNTIVVVQVATTVVLLAGAALFVRSLSGAEQMDFGMQADRIAIMTRQLAERDYTPEAGLQYIRDIRARLASQPGVEDAQVSRAVELTLAQLGAEVQIAPAGGGSKEPRTGFRNSVTPGYLEMVGVPMLRGRTIQEGDVAGAPLVAVVNQTFASRFWPDEDPIGQRFVLTQTRTFDFGGSPEPRVFEVVGLAREGKYLDIDDEAVSYCWLSLYQDYSPLIVISAKGVDSAEAMVTVLRNTVETAADEMPLVTPSTLESQMSIQFLPLVLGARVLGWGGLFGLVLALVGIYGVVAYAVTLRTREMAIRMAVGASASQVLGRIVRDAMRLTAWGLAIGLLILAPLAPLAESQLFGVSPFDPVSFGGTALLLVLAALAASLVPASRALRIDPIQILREE